MISYISLANAAVPAVPAPVDTVAGNAVLTDHALAERTLVSSALASAALASAALAGALASAATPSRVGASLRCCGPTWPRDGALLASGTFVVGRQARGEIALFGSGTHAAGLAEFACQQRTSNKYAHSTQMYARPTTRIAAISGGAGGPHPARDPV